MGAVLTPPRSITISGTTVENEPIIKSDAASSDIMEWQASTGSSTVKLREGSGNTVVLDVDGSLELADKIKSVTSATTVGAVFLYSTKDDSDGGAWRKKCKGLSWFDEASSATRSARSEFPAMALIVADNATPETITIYDLDDPAMPMWMVFNTGDNEYYAENTGSFNAVYALNGRIFVATTTSLRRFDFTNDTGYLWNNGNEYLNSGNVANRNNASNVLSAQSGSGIVNAAVNDIAATVLEGAEIGALGLPIPTVAVGCNANGISVIHPDGSVYDFSNGAYGVNKVAWDADGSLWGNFVTSNARSVSRWLKGQLFADSAGGNNEYVLSLTNTDWQSIGRALGNTQNAFCQAGTNTFAHGGASGLQILKRAVGFDALNTAEPPNLCAYITSDYNTGYMVGDIRGAWLAYGISSGVSHADHVQSAFSVKANTLTETGTVTIAAVATGADLTAFSGWSASNYLSRASDTDFDFGTLDFSIMFWVKDTDATEPQDFVSRSDATQVAGDWLIQSQNDATIDFYRHTGSGWALESRSTTGVITANQWTQVVAVRRSGVFNWYINGKFDASTADVNSYTPSGGSALTIGHSLGDAGDFADNSSLSLFRISATAPTPQQIKEIYDAEKPLFAANAKCLLQGDNATVQGLAYDKSTGILQATQAASVTSASATMFRGLEVADTFLGNAHDSSWTYNSATLLAANGGVSTYYRSGGSLLCDLPAIDVRAELNEGADKLPDDGKLHFSGVTTDATPTVIGQVPIANDEKYYINLRAVGCRYQNADSSYRIVATINQCFTRTMAGNVVAEPVTSKLTEIESSTAAIDVACTVSTGPQTVNIGVTGVAGLRLEWIASVEVQRISDKTYER
jgi:hypothetical protein